MFSEKMRTIALILLLPILLSCSHDRYLFDPQGNRYQTVTIGEQVWMAANLRYDVGDGTYCYDDDPLQCEAMGRLYTWSAALAAADQIPGWHLPSREEWEELIAFCGPDSAGYRKLISPATEFDPQWSGVRTSAAEFKAGDFKPGGFRGVNHWSSSTSDTNTALAYSVALLDHLQMIGPHNYPKVNACSVRLLKDR
ncbi:MAG: hypothetical protein JSW03_04780 [Candidatus Eiseniibacteriota bacterium]|nr:MAG: hypothetical protein JSW03_04780 [Candidatus Eisenbacteria bacterium]